MANMLRSLPRLGMADAQRLFGLTARALRFYEERGLLEAHRDRSNRRYFDGEARQRLVWIAALRAADIPLSDVREVLRADENDRRKAALAKLDLKRAELEGQLAAVEIAHGLLTAPAAAPAGLRRTPVRSAA